MLRSCWPLAGALAAVAVLVSGCTVNSHQAQPSVTPSRTPLMMSVAPALVGLRCSSPAQKFVVPPSSRYTQFATTGTTHTLAPTDATSAIDCHYAGMNVRHVRVGTLLGATKVPNPRHLATLLNESTHVAPGTYHCPMDDGTIDQLIFSSPTHGVSYVNVPRNGCAWLTSSLIGGAWSPTEAASQALGSLEKGYPAP